MRGKGERGCGFGHALAGVIEKGRILEEGKGVELSSHEAVSRGLE